MEKVYDNFREALEEFIDRFSMNYIQYLINNDPSLDQRHHTNNVKYKIKEALLELKV